MQNVQELKELIANEYLNKFFTFYLSRTPIIQDAEDLSQKAACECLDALNRVDEITNVNAYFWSVAHNVYKNYLNRKDNYILNDDYCKMQIADTSYNEYNDQKELHNDIRKSLSILSGLYRKIIVMYYYHELKIKDIAKKLNISQDMVKYYLSNGKKKLKEIYNMNKEIGEVSFNPKDFSIYYSGIDFASVNVWELFKRKLPCQIALICYAKPKTISEIANEVGCSSCFIEDELTILLNAGVLIQKVKDKYQTNFYIISKEELDIVVCRYPMFFKFESHIKVEKIADAENVFVCSKKFYEEKFQNCDDYVCPMILPGSSEKRRNIEQYLIDNNINYSVEIEIPNSTLLKKLIINNMGIGYINKKFIEDEVESGLVVVIESFKNIPTDSISIVYNTKCKNKLVLKYIDSLKKTIKNSDN